MKSLQRQRPRRGIFLADAMFGFAIIAVLGLVLVTGITQSRRSQVRLDDGAAASRIAQRALGELQAGRVVPKQFAEAEVTVAPATGGAEVAGQVWVAVSVNYHGRSATLVGLTPRGGAR
jgi:Na+-transporting NADH:ubiquinone oxidoreductase subunit NqrF